MLQSVVKSTSLKSSKSYRDVNLAYKEYPADASAYEILEDCGRGASATVHRARCIPLDEIVAIKKMNLESMPCELSVVVKEAQTMKSFNHPNVLALYCSFVHGEDLWMVMPLVSGGSVLHIMKYAHPDGLGEVIIATIVREVLKALQYVHSHGGIHRDIKAGNILVDKDGSVRLADFGVAVSRERGGSWDKTDRQGGSRNTFAGTPCWMAPEVMQESEYDASADIWSLGITVLEMAHGHAPFAKMAPMKVLLKTIHDAPPELEDKKGTPSFSKYMRDFVGKCLVKDPKARQTATELLSHKFFKQARDEDYLVRHLVSGMPSLPTRVQQIRQGQAATNAEENDKALKKSQDEYKKGVSAWNFDVAALKAQAAMEPIAEGEDDEDGWNQPSYSQQPSGLYSEASSQQLMSSGSTHGSAAALDRLAAAVAGPGPSRLSADIPRNGSAVLSAFAGTAYVDDVAESSNASPSMSRESSHAQLAGAGGKPPKTRGRFLIIDENSPAHGPNPHAEPPPDMLDPPSRAHTGAGADLPPVQALLDGAANAADASLARPSLDPTKAVLAQDSFGSSVGGGEASKPAAEPTKRKAGRFTVTEEGGGAAAAAAAAAAVAAVDGAAKPKAAGPVALTGIYPRLQELFDHAAAQQSAITRLMSAVYDAERGLQPALLAPASSSNLFDNPEAAALVARVADAEKRIAALEEDNARLRARNAELEAGAPPGTAPPPAAASSQPMPVPPKLPEPPLARVSSGAPLARVSVPSAMAKYASFIAVSAETSPSSYPPSL